MTTNVLTIGHLAKKTGTKVETIRFYEKSGLLPKPGRTDGNYRAYDRAHLNRLSFIRRARDLGFSLDQVRGLLSLTGDRSQSCAGVDAIANEHRAEIERKIRDLQALKAELDNLIDRCVCRTVAQCRIIDSLSPAH
jgi:Cu(I)-responsive transcriptional regulator